MWTTVHCTLWPLISVASYLTLGHVPPPSLDFQLFNFLVTSEPHMHACKLWHWTPCGCLSRTNILAHRPSVVSVYCMNFIISLFSCVTLKLFSLSFVALLAPKPGDATAVGCSAFRNYNTGGGALSGTFLTANQHIKVHYVLSKATVWSENEKI